MSSISDIYSAVNVEYTRSLTDSRERKEGNRAEQSVIYRYFFRERLMPYNVAESGEVIEGEYVFSGEKEPEKKEKENLLQLYRMWDGKKEIKGKMKINPVMLMHGYNQYLKDGKKFRFIRLLLSYMTERPIRYREGHVYYTRGKDGTGEKAENQMYLSFLAGLFSIVEGSRFEPSDLVEMRSLQNALKKLLSVVCEEQKADERIKEKLDRITPLELRRITDGLLRTSLHVNIKDYFFNMGYPVTGGTEAAYEATKERRKLDKSVAFLEHCMQRLDYQIVSGSVEDLVKRREDEGPAYKAACETLLEKMNGMAERTRFTRAMVPLMTHRDIVLCVIGREYYRYLYKTIVGESPDHGSFHPKYRMSNGNKPKKVKSYCFAVMQMVVHQNDFLCYEPDLASDCFDEAEAYYNTRIRDRDPLIAGVNRQLLTDDEDGMKMIPEVFWEFFYLSGGFDDEQTVREEAATLASAEEEGVKRMKEKKG